MKRVQLIVTGDLEKLSLHKSLARVFSDDVEFLPPIKRDGFTSATIRGSATHGRPAKSSRTVDKLADTMLAEVEPGGRHANPADLIFLIDDLELANSHQPRVVVEHFRDALQLSIERRAWKTNASRTKAIRGLARRCSFHLMKPMVEAYFFGDPQALTRAGGVRRSAFLSGQDVEPFAVDDAPYASVANGHRPWATADRHRHPKRYIDYLCTNPADDLSHYSSAWTYSETNHGRRALETIDWGQVLANSEHALFARALFEDLAYGLDEPNPFPGACAPETSLKDGLIRNA